MTPKYFFYFKMKSLKYVGNVSSLVRRTFLGPGEPGRGQTEVLLGLQRGGVVSGDGEGRLWYETWHQGDQTTPLDLPLGTHVWARHAGEQRVVFYGWFKIQFHTAHSRLPRGKSVLCVCHLLRSSLFFLKISFLAFS